MQRSILSLPVPCAVGFTYEKHVREGIEDSLTRNALLRKDMIDSSVRRQDRFRKVATGAPNNFCSGVWRVIAVQGLQ